MQVELHLLLGGQEEFHFIHALSQVSSFHMYLHLLLLLVGAFSRGRTCHGIINKLDINTISYYNYSDLLEPDIILVGRLVAPGNSEGLIEELMFSMLSASVTAGMVQCR